MKPSIAAKLESLARRLGEVGDILSAEAATRDMEQYRRLSREHAELTPVVGLFEQYRRAEADIAAAQEMLADPQMRIYAEAEIISESAGEVGGYKEVIARIIGQGAYSMLKFESGGHRVQRVPATETQGRIHTSACTVAVLPEADRIEDVVLNPAELRIDTFRASGAGGQHVNKTDSAIRVTHLPTGIVVECPDDRSQHKNKARALAVLAARIKDKQMR